MDKLKPSCKNKGVKFLFIPTKYIRKKNLLAYT